MLINGNNIPSRPLANDGACDVAAVRSELGPVHFDLHRWVGAREPFVRDVERPLTEWRVVKQGRRREASRILSSSMS